MKSKIKWMFVGLVVLFQLLPNVSRAATLDKLARRSGGTLFGVAYGNGMYVAVGQAGHISVSTDGITWTNQIAPSQATYFNVAFGGGKFVAVGAGGVIITSTGITGSWTNATSGVTSDWYDVTYTGSTFVAVGAGGVVRTSTSGTSWTARNSNTSSGLNGATFGSSLSVAVGDSGAIVTSPTGVTWTVRTNTSADSLASVAFGGGSFLAIGNPDDMLWSTNGTTWTNIPVSSPAARVDVAYGNGKFAVVGDKGLVMAYPNASNSWDTLTTPGSNLLWSVIFGTNQFVAVGQGGCILTATNASGPWTLRVAALTTGTLNAITPWGDSGFVAVGDNGAILTSANGTNWTSRTSTNSQSLNAVATDNFGRLAAVGAAGTILISPDGTNWHTKQSYPSIASAETLYAVAPCADSFVAFGDGGSAWYSAGFEGQSFVPGDPTWQFVGFFTTNTLRAATRGVQAVGDRGARLSGGPLYYNLSSVGLVTNFYGLTTVTGLTVNVGLNGTIVRSGTSRTSGTGFHLRAVTYGNSRFVAVGDAGTVLSSGNGITWTNHPQAAFDNLHGVAYNNGHFVAVGTDGTILQVRLTGDLPPAIIVPPAAHTNSLGTVASFDVLAQGKGPFTYHWRKNAAPLANGGNVSGANAQLLTLSNVTTTDAASYSVIVSNSLGSATSSVAVLTIVSNAPVILVQPVAVTNVHGIASATFFASADGAAPLNYHWRRNSTNLVDGGNIYGSATSLLTISNAEFADAGAYSLVVSNTAGYAVSSNAILTIQPTFPEAIDATNLTWTLAGDGYWNGQSVVTHDGIDAAQSPTLGDLQSAYFETTVTGPGQISFWWKVSSQFNADYLAFYTNHFPYVFISGQVGWTNIVLPINPGTQILSWRYVKDFGTAAGEDRGWVDQVTYTPTAVTLVSSSASPGTFSLSWGANSGSTYQVQYKTNLAQTNWINAGGTILATNNTVSVSYPTQPDPKRFYRVVVP